MSYLINYIFYFVYHGSLIDLQNIVNNFENGIMVIIIKIKTCCDVLEHRYQQIII